MLDVVVNLMQKKITWHAFELHKYHSVPTNKDKNVKKEGTKRH